MHHKAPYMKSPHVAAIMNKCVETTQAFFTMLHGVRRNWNCRVAGEYFVLLLDHFLRHETVQFVHICLLKF